MWTLFGVCVCVWRRTSGHDKNAEVKISHSRLNHPLHSLTFMSSSEVVRGPLPALFLLSYSLCPSLCFQPAFEQICWVLGSDNSYWSFKFINHSEPLSWLLFIRSHYTNVAFVMCSGGIFGSDWHWSTQLWLIYLSNRNLRDLECNVRGVWTTFPYKHFTSL